jgi:5-hydroxyisourate hydrolase
MSTITTHVLDTGLGVPAAGITVALESRAGDTLRWSEVGRGATDADGRIRTLVPDGRTIDPGVYRLVFDTRRYFDAQGRRAFFPSVTITFEVTSRDTHYHVPLLLSPFGYSTYRGS